VDTFESYDDVLAFAITKEAEAAALYRHWATRTTQPAMRAALEQFAGEEDGHRVRLESLRVVGFPASSAHVAPELGLADTLKGRAPGPDLDYQDLLIMAIRAEQAAYDLYTGLAGVTEDPGVRELLRALARDEAQHRLRFENEYEQEYLREN